MKHSAGFTLVEAMVVITIMTIVTYAVVAGLPIARTNQALENDIRTVRSLTVRASQLALNEIRSAECLELAGGDSSIRRLCSNIGLAMSGNQIQIFADLNGDRQYSDADVTLETHTVTATIEPPLTVLFEADPPTVTMYVNQQIVGAGQTVPLTLTVGTTARLLTIGPYGIIEDAQE